MPTRVYKHRILQDGELPLSPDGRVNRSREHRCTATLVWPTGSRPTRTNSVVIDPSFTSEGWQCAVRRLAALGVSAADIGYYFVSHPHYDHTLVVPAGVDRPNWQQWRPRLGTGLSGLSAVACPGHDPDLQALKFFSESGEVWIVGDAILNREWLLDWSYYWPNGYGVDEVIRTWRSVAAVLARAAVVIPGHGPAIEVTATLLCDLVEGFPEAPRAASCPDVMTVLKARQTKLMALAK